MTFVTSGKPTLDDVSEVMRLYLTENAPVWRKVDKGIYEEMQKRIEKIIVCHALKHHKGVQLQAAKLIGLSREHIRRIMLRHGIKADDFREPYKWPHPKQLTK